MPEQVFVCVCLTENQSHFCLKTTLDNKLWIKD